MTGFDSLLLKKDFQVSSRLIQTSQRLVRDIYHSEAEGDVFAGIERSRPVQVHPKASLVNVFRRRSGSQYLSSREFKRCW